MNRNIGIVLLFVGNYLMRAVCFGGATFLAYHDKAGWGWLIFAGIISGLSTSDKEEES